eukprot:g16298.t1
MPNTAKKTPSPPSRKAEVESPSGGHPGGGGAGGDQAEQGRPFRRKRRAWLFRVEGTTNHGITEADLLTSVCKRYRTVKTLFIKADGLAPASGAASCALEGKKAEKSRKVKATPASDREPTAVTFVEITFAGPQPSENCSALLCLLLGGDSVQAWPVELPRGRKRKNTVASTCEEAAGEDVISEDVANTETPWRSLSDVSSSLPPSPTPQELELHEPMPQGFSTEDASPPPPPPPSQQQPYPYAVQQNQHQDPHQRQMFGTQESLIGLDPYFPAAQPPLGGQPVQSAYGDSNGNASFAFGGPYFSAQEGGGISDSADGGGGRVLLPMKEVRVEPSRRECDLEGRPFPKTSNGAPIAVGPAGDRQCHLVFTGLEETGHDLNSLRVTALFGVDAVHQTATVTSPLQVGGDGRAYSSVFYPSLQEIWPELYDMPGVQAVEVDIEVEILSDSGSEYRYHGPQLKVVYHRAWPPANAAAAPDGGAPREHWGGAVPTLSPVSYGEDEFRPVYSRVYADNHR